MGKGRSMGSDCEVEGVVSAYVDVDMDNVVIVDENVNGVVPVDVNVALCKKSNPMLQFGRSSGKVGCSHPFILQNFNRNILFFFFSFFNFFLQEDINVYLENLCTK